MKHCMICGAEDLSKSNSKAYTVNLEFTPVKIILCKECEEHLIEDGIKLYLANYFSQETDGTLSYEK